MKFSITVICGLAVGAAALLVSCAPEQDAYLKKGVRKVTQADVTKEFGPPHITKEAVLDGETVWMYRYAMNDSDLNPMSFDNMFRSANTAGNAAMALIGKGGADSGKEKVVCVRYVLTFNKDKVLKDWKREGC
jgi:hypothetical protein